MRATWEAGRLFEFVWEASASLPTANQSIFAHVIDGNYCDLSERERERGQARTGGRASQSAPNAPASCALR